ncbi:MAG: hypothetical protein ACYS9X_13765 [Planctomycetota bacterium]|jgi:hypothetical protein
MPAKAKKKQAKKGTKGTKAGAAKKGKAAPPKQEPKAKPGGKKAPAADLEALKKTAQEAKAVLDKAGKEANALREQAKGVEAGAKKAYVEAVAPYRDACRKAGVECEFAGGRATNVTPAVRFIVEKVKNGVKVMLTGKPETEQVIPFAALKESIGKAALAYTEKFIGPKETIGNKQGSLGNRIRAVLAKK